MNEVIHSMLKKYKCRSSADFENVIKEIVQEIALLGLWRAKFYEIAAFYGGSALRILYGMNRFSEDLDFSLLKPAANIDLGKYYKAIKVELTSFGFDAEIIPKIKSRDSQIESAFIKAGTLQTMVSLKMQIDLRKKIHRDKILKIKFEVDKDPPGNFTTEVKYLLQPVPFSINSYSLSSLLAGKLHAILCRKWQHRVKGRDWYDLVWFISNNINLNLEHLESRMRQSSHLEKNEFLTREKLLSLLRKRVEQIDFNMAKEDVRNFIKDQDSLLVWNRDFFSSIIQKINIAVILETGNRKRETEERKNPVDPVNPVKIS